ncbi:hypothetical protein RU08_12345 [Pseudomonas fulva]|uniref:Uncharacterized protein n=1 Tax=Pseudomonas fulva TaxID=47880 RepID=A0A0D0KQA1_9PSED|nr:hypothetical protein RU08_12345 [Pseudomonas fulva]
MFGRAIGKKIPLFIKILIDQPFTVCDGGVLGLVQVVEEGSIQRQRHAPGGASVRRGDPAAPSPGGWDAWMLHDFGADVMIAVGAL